MEEARSIDIEMMTMTEIIEEKRGILEGIDRVGEIGTQGEKSEEMREEI